jgi:2-polyprenyl-6-hydroxyphenyl methylase/3-demethylubiquinone-9 3-methyltransferase
MTSLSKRFSFGRNWAKYSDLVDEVRIEKAMKHLQDRFDLREFQGSLLDIGCGSGVFSVAASRLGSKVVAFDYDQISVETTKKMMEKFGERDNFELISTGDILDSQIARFLEKPEYIYSWGVLHHTGDLWEALDRVAFYAKTGCIFVTAIYNDLGPESEKWTRLKRIYVKHFFMRPLLLLYSWYLFWGKQQVRALLSGRDPFKSWREYSIDSRGMSAWYDLVDWAGGYPFEVSTPEKLTSFMKERGWECEAIWRNQGIGNNEFRFVKR